MSYHNDVQPSTKYVSSSSSYKAIWDSASAPMDMPGTRSAGDMVRSERVRNSISKPLEERNVVFPVILSSVCRSDSSASR